MGQAQLLRRPQLFRYRIPPLAPPRATTAAVSSRPGFEDSARIIFLAYLFLVPLLFLRTTPEPFEFPKMLLLRTAAIVLAALGLCHAIGRIKPDFLSAKQIAKQVYAGLICRVNAGVLLFVGSAILSTIYSISPRTSFTGANDSFRGLATILSCGVLYFAARWLFRTPGDVGTMFAVVAGAAGLSALYAIIQSLGLDPFAWASVSHVQDFARPFAGMGHGSHLGGYLAMGLPCLLVPGLFFGKGRSRLAGRLAIALLIALGIVFSLSRAAWLATALAALTVATLVWVKPPPGYGRACMLAVIVLVSCAAVASQSPAVIYRLRHLGEGTSRRYIWHAAIAIFADHPVHGCGPDTFGLEFAGKRAPDYWRTEWNVTPNDAHCLPLSIMATQGAIGAGAALVVVIGLACRLRIGIRSPDPAPRTTAIALAAALVAFVADQCLSPHTVVSLSMFAVFAAAASKLTTSSGFGDICLVRQPHGAGRRLCQAGVALAAVFLVHKAVIQPLRAAECCQAGDQLMVADPQSALVDYNHAVEQDAANDAYRAKRAMAGERIALGKGDESTKRSALALARSDYERAVQLVPVAAYHHAGLGRVLGLFACRGESPAAEAFAEFESALKLDPANAYIYGDAGRTSLFLGDLARARDYWSRGSKLYPEFSPFRAQLGYVAMIEGDDKNGLEMLREAAGGDWFGEEDARAIALQKAFALLLADGRRTDARVMLVRARKYAPDNATARELLAKLAAKS
jgi:O-antigen ligase/tetratricopeptide (TPR) repeat protein